MPEIPKAEQVALDVPCDCAGCCSIMRLNRWTDDPELYIDWYTAHDIGKGVWGRLRVAVRVLFKREEVRHGSVLYPASVERVRAWLDEQSGDRPLTGNEGWRNVKVTIKGDATQALDAIDRTRRIVS